MYLPLFYQELILFACLFFPFLYQSLLLPITFPIKTASLRLNSSCTVLGLSQEQALLLVGAMYKDMKNVVINTGTNNNFLLLTNILTNIPPFLLDEFLGMEVTSFTLSQKSLLNKPLSLHY